MARKSRKNIASADEHPVIKVWKTALYIRLSVEYNGKRGDSLETQRQIMEDCLALCPDVEITEIYIDNGVSGQTFDRQGFQKMLADIESGKIDCTDLFSAVSRRDAEGRRTVRERLAALKKKKRKGNER